METFKSFNNNLLASNNMLTTCCCGGETVPFGYYYEGITCEGANRLRIDGACAEWDQCRTTNRIFVHQNSKCDQGEIKICECQLLETPNFGPLVKTGSSTDALQILNQTGFVLTVIWSNTTLTLNLSNGASLIYDFTHKTLSEIATAINTWNSLISTTFNVSTSLPGFFIKDVTKIINNESSALFPSRNSGLYFVYNNVIDPTGALASSDYDIFASNITTSLGRLIGPEMTTIHNSLGDVLNVRFFEMKFSGSLCGRRHNLISGYNCLVDNSFIPFSINFNYPEYRVNDYYLKGSRQLSDHKYINSNTSNLCYYDDILSSSSFTALYEVNTGPSSPVADENLSCCPQGGATFGNSQTVGFPTDGYAFTPTLNFSHWWNLEKTIIKNDCRVLPPEFFAVSKKGRHDFVHSYDKPLHLTCDCDFPNDCDSANDNLPTNCTPELFVAQLHKNVPWGVFGSYYAGIEGDTHPAWLFPYNDPDFNPFGDQSYLSTVELCARDGWRYRPSGMIGTLGTWRYTEQINVALDVKRPIPFHVGPGVFDDLDYRCQIASGSIPSGLIITGNDGCQPIYISYNTSGKTVGNFIDAFNALRFTIPEGDQCPVFAFCAGSESARSVMANKIINVSSELFEQQSDCGNNSSFIGGTGPENDLYKDRISAQSFASVPLSYPDMNKNSIFNTFNLAAVEYDAPRYMIGLPTGLVGDVGGIPDTFSVHYDCGLPVSPEPIKAPPICRWFNKHLPLEATTKTDVATEFLYNPTIWWTPIMGQVENVISISKSGIDVQVTNLTVQVTTGSIVVRSYSGAIPFNSGIIRLTGYNTYSASQCINDLNNFRFNYITGVGTYQPISAQYNNNLIQAPLFIHNSITDSSVYTYGRPVSGFSNTTYNYGYQEPFSDKIETSIFTNSSNIDAWMRRRCGRIESSGNNIIRVNNFCVPPDATALANDVNCEADQALSNGWLYTYGCGSPKCKTEYFIKSTRCDCSQVYRCDGTEGKFIGHPFNFEGGEATNQEYGEFQVSQPTFYMCEYNFHPECDVPMMVKVPFQVNDGSRNVLWHNGEWGTYYNSESVDPAIILALANLTCSFCNNDLNICPRNTRSFSNIQGWCQYIDPLGVKVPYEAIPYSWPSKAVVAFRSSKPFCSINHWNFKPEFIYSESVSIGNMGYGCKPEQSLDCLTFAADEGVNCIDCPGHEVCPDCLNYDRIENCKPVYDTGINNQDNLTVLLKPIYRGDSGPVCSPSGTSTCHDYDITCSTACCECVLACQENQDCLVLVKHPYVQTVQYDLEFRSEGAPGQCAPEFLFTNICGHMVFGCCEANCNVIPCIAGTCDSSYTLHLKKIKTSCNCIVEGCLTYAEPICSINCSAAPTSVCYSTYIPVIPDPVQPPSCNYVCNNVPTRLTGSNVCCSSPCLIGGLRNESGCSFFADTYQGDCSTEDIGDCEEYHAERTTIKENRYFGVSPIDGVTLGIYSACEWHGLETLTTTESLDITDKKWTDCNIFTIEGREYQYVKNLRFTIESWIPGYANISIASGNTPLNDTRFLDHQDVNMGCNCNKKIKNVNLVKPPKVEIFPEVDNNLAPSVSPIINKEISPLSKAWEELKKTGGAVKNLINIASKQSDPLKWFKDGITGLIKCVDGKTIYSDKDILKNRDVCRTCPYSTKEKGLITLQSQCMGPDPENNNVPCGCFIVCKTQVGTCPLKKFTTTPLTISV